MDAGSKSLKRSETKSALLKRKSTVSNVLQNLHVVPSFSEAFSGDILPEAVLLKNILEEMMTSLNYLSTLIYILTSPLPNARTPIGNDKELADLKVRGS